MQKIQKKIVGFNVVSKEDATPKSKAPAAEEILARPECLRGTTYKIKSPAIDSAIYITINDIVMNKGTAEENVQPFEIFFNSKNMEHYQWIVALTRVMSAVFRKGGDVAFLVEELRSVFDPRGGYFKKGGKYMPSLCAEIADVVETHLISIGIIKPVELDEHQQAMVAEKIQKFSQPQAEVGDTTYPANATLCGKCQVKAVVIDGGCATCLACADSKCG